MKWVVIDVHGLCHRALHTTGDLSHRGIRTGVIYGFLRDLKTLTDTFRTENLVFCFDSIESHRESMTYSGYKESRRQRIKNGTTEERGARKELTRQINSLRKKYLPAIGYKNCLYQPGYEADDLIAEICYNTINKQKDEVVVISDDSDLHQLLCSCVSLYSLRTMKRFAVEDFVNKWGIQPSDWPMVKAIAGCSSDDVPGVDGVGEKTAIKFIRGQLLPKSKAYEKIIAASKTFARNLELVSLPYPGTNPITLTANKISTKGWTRVVKHLGIRTGAYPPKVMRRK